MPLGRRQMSELQVREGRARKSEEVGAENGQQQEIRFMRLEDIPIEDALHEKEVFEKGDFAHKLNPKHSSGPVILSDDARRRRIVEVYKRCFQEADLPAGPKVVSDFIAHFPRLIFDADWLKEELIRVDHTLPDLGDQRKKGKKEILQAIAKGFRRAASSNLRKPATEQYY